LISLVHPFRDRGRFAGSEPEASFILSGSYYGHVPFEGEEELGENVVVLHGFWPICLAVAALVRRDDVLSWLCQGLHQLMPPRVPQLRIAVAKNN
jgi:hypothetical protein